MGRQLKRVPLDFSWPIGQKWKGYLCPYQGFECNTCGGDGASAEYKRLSDQWFGNNSIEHRIQNPYNSRCTYNANAAQYNLKPDEIEHLWREGRLGGSKKCPTKEEALRYALTGIGFDGITRWLWISFVCNREGYEENCHVCNGKGEFYYSDEIEQAIENFDGYDPPTGEGFQLWENTSEGSPMTPVFESLELLCEYLERENISVFGSNTATKEEWANMIGKDFISYQRGNLIFI